MASRPWEQHEVEVLEELSARRDWINDAVSMLPDRSVKSLRSRMQLVRREAGTDTSNFVDTAWMANAAWASGQLLAAINRAGVRP